MYALTMLLVSPLINMLHYYGMFVTIGEPILLNYWINMISSNPYFTLGFTLYCIVYMYVLVTQSCPSLRDRMDCSLPGFSVHGISQARILEWVAISFSRGYSRSRDPTLVSHISWSLALAGKFFTTELPGRPSETLAQSILS